LRLCVSALKNPVALSAFIRFRRDESGLGNYFAGRFSTVETVGYYRSPLSAFISLRRDMPRLSIRGLNRHAVIDPKDSRYPFPTGILIISVEIVPFPARLFQTTGSPEISNR
jgi:hypothetical protein